MVRHHGASALRHDRRVRHAGIVTHRLDVIDDVVGVFLERVVHARFEVRLRAVVVHAQAAADVQVLQPGARARQLRVHAGGLVQRRLHDADVGNLAAEVKVQELEAVLHAEPLQVLESLQDLRNRQPELRPVAAGRLPSAAAPRGQLHAHADHRPHAHLLRVVQDQLELGVLLDDRDDRAPDLLRQHRGLDVLRILEPVADDRRAVGGHRHHREQFRLGACLQPELVRPAEAQDLLDYLPLLVHLDRIHAGVAAGIRVLRDGSLKRVVDVTEPMPEDVAEPDEHRQIDAACLQVVGELLQVDRLRRVLRRMHEDVPRVAHGEVPLPPPGDLVQLLGVDRTPLLVRAHRQPRPSHRRAHGTHDTGVRAVVGGCRPGRFALAPHRQDQGMGDPR